MIQIMARITARPGNESELLAVLQDLVLPSREEAGCVSYELFQNEDEPSEFVTVEQWRDHLAADNHLATPHVQRAIALAATLLAESPRIHRYRHIGR